MTCRFWHRVLGRGDRKKGKKKKIANISQARRKYIFYAGLKIMTQDSWHDSKIHLMTIVPWLGFSDVMNDESTGNERTNGWRGRSGEHHGRCFCRREKRGNEEDFYIYSGTITIISRRKRRKERLSNVLNRCFALIFQYSIWLIDWLIDWFIRVILSRVIPPRLPGEFLGSCCIFTPTL